ncbi:undecaprenyl-phosphate glucose phosphotransferase [Lysinibacillus sp. FSL K6-0232]|uniref:undecaprenyl-phosphate glucose phosphotransferase n=1 Tax=Lysinibacillus sp. FSL K6-0232 TaxID=2921425 RepID=UPI0030FA4D8D
MIRGRESLLTKLYIITDLLVIQSVFFLTWVLRFNFLGGVVTERVSFEDYFIWNLIFSVVYVIVGFFMSLYISKRRKNFTSEMIKIFQVNFFSMFIMLSLLFLFRTVDISRVFLFIYFLLNVSFIISYRFAVKKGLWRMRRSGYNKQFIVVIGAGALGKKFAKTVMERQEYGFEILGYLDDRKKSMNEKDVASRPILGKIEQLEEIINDKLVDEVVIALPLTVYNKYGKIIAICEKTGVRVSIIPDFYDILPANPNFEKFGDFPIVNVRDVPLDDYVNRYLKRLFDIVFALTAIIVTSPLLLFIAIGVKLTSKGPILFRQERVGLNRRTFNMYKFRSMRHVSEDISNTQWTVENDPRRTKFGTFIRKTSLDELPQFFNVLKGDMSVVGPRPERPYFVEQFKEDVPKYMVKHQIRPGITGWAQVCGLRGDTSIPERIKHDIYYIENWTLFFDIEIIFKTIINGFINKNAY